MRIGIMGAGRVGCALGDYLLDSERVEAIGWYSRSPQSARTAALTVGARALEHNPHTTVISRAYDSPRAIAAASDVLFITVPDDAIGAVWNELRTQATDLLGGLAVGHCSGCLSSQVLTGAAEIGASVFSMHPMQAVSERFPEDGRDQLAHTFFALEGDARCVADMAGLLRSLGNPTRTIAAEDKTRYHAAAVMASNLPIALWQAAVETLQSCGFTADDARAALAGMIRHNADSFCKSGAEEALTGPVDRGDAGTVAAHLAALRPEARELYVLLSRALLAIAAAKNPQRDYADLRAVLEEAAAPPAQS